MTTTHTDPILQTKDLTRHFNGFTAVDRVNLQVKSGSIHALIGPNGAGKTTVFNLLTKFLPPSEGSIVFNGQDITNTPPANVASEGLVRSFQISAVFPHLTVLENVRVALQRKSVSPYRFWVAEESLSVLNDQVMALLESVDLQGYAKDTAVNLPYGRKRALEIATTLALDPILMLLDEPTQGMGHEDVDRVTDLIRKVSADRTILMVEHNLKVVSRLADRITVLQRGAVLCEGDYNTVSRDPRVQEAYLGTQASSEVAQ